MRRLLLALIGLVIFVFVAAPLSAQRPKAKKVDTLWALPPNAAGMTWCEWHGPVVVVRAAIDLDVLRDTLYAVEEVRTHEQVHIDEMQANPKLCDPTWKQLLGMEVKAYCASVQVPIKHGTPTDSAYFKDLAFLVRQFKNTDNEVSYTDVVDAWYAACGSLLGITSGQR